MQLTTNSAPASVFVSFTSNDKEYLEKLETYLFPLVHRKKIRISHLYKIEPGKEIQKEAKAAIQYADIILLLISSDSLASSQFWDFDLSASLERHRDGEARIIPVLLRPCLWHDTPIAHINILPRSQKPISSYADREAAYFSVTEEIEKCVDALYSLRKKKEDYRKLLISEISKTSELNDVQRKKLNRMAWGIGLDDNIAKKIEESEVSKSMRSREDKLKNELKNHRKYENFLEEIYNEEGFIDESSIEILKKRQVDLSLSHKECARIEKKVLGSSIDALMPHTSSNPIVRSKILVTSFIQKNPKLYQRLMFTSLSIAFLITGAGIERSRIILSRGPLLLSSEGNEGTLDRPVKEGLETHSEEDLDDASISKSSYSIPQDNLEQNIPAYTYSSNDRDIQLDETAKEEFEAISSEEDSRHQHDRSFSKKDLIKASDSSYKWISNNQFDIHPKDIFLVDYEYEDGVKSLPLYLCRSHSLSTNQLLVGKLIFGECHIPIYEFSNEEIVNESRRIEIRDEYEVFIPLEKNRWITFEGDEIPERVLPVNPDLDLLVCRAEYGQKTSEGYYRKASHPGVLDLETGYCLFPWGETVGYLHRDRDRNANREMVEVLIFPDDF
ncbi:toll/interleukin-1 receptor domain-containing protein [Oscillatoria sp. CS-180]|uniref:toll/interleukin-1 receptor domain-containing protein n=1 Tax=Oscillatoria sp. CS-180 TaxID=3021720 RepID=UPI00232E9346|nr:toll/interleukin-1 receptor domain-containing protein [Oscillatoria sp. CS-180]MDB9526510.1 toll/interleukin-1 receptor domain-containing protein [Oscillatoria sp. CS-180]